MLGMLPSALNVNGTSRPINPDFRNILQILAAFADPELKDNEKVYICLVRMYTDLKSIPNEDYEAAYYAAISFMECGQKAKSDNSPRLVNWEKDEHLIFPAVNKVAGVEVRALPFLHWWTFMGYFQSIDRDDLWGAVLIIRQKRAKGKPLEKHEKEFFQANRELCSVDRMNDKSKPEDDLARIFNELAQKGGA